MPDTRPFFEVKRTFEIGIWKRVLAKVYDAYLGLSAEWQECFVFHACIVGEKTEVERNVGQLKRLAQEQPFKVEFRFFIFDNGTVKEIS